MNYFKKSILIAVVLLWGASASFATNGMLIEGYGPISHAMGGTSMAFDNGTAAMINNPATLGLMEDGNYFELALGLLRPNVRLSMGENEYTSDSKNFLMPCIGYIKKDGAWSYGMGIYSQGGMGTDFLSNLNMYSQVIVGKVIMPVSYSVSDRLIVGGSFQYVRAEMDLVMGPFNFKDGSDFSGAATGSGFSGMIGFLYKISDSVNIGAAYQHKAGIGDITGRGARVKDFDMPAAFSVGLSYRPTEKLLLAADYQKVLWSRSMKAITVSQNGMEAQIPQHWDDQDVLALGVAYEVTPEFTLRVGANFGNNPVSKNATPLFPAIVKNHYTTGFTYKFNDRHSLSASLAYAPRVEVANGLDFTGSRTSHSQTSFQLMYRFSF